MQIRKMLFLLLSLTVALTMCSTAYAGRGGTSGGSKSSGGGSKPSSGGGSKPKSGGSKPGTSGGSKNSSGGTKPKPKPSITKPSTGTKPQPAPLTKLVPATPPPNLVSSTGRVRFQPAGRNMAADRQELLRNPSYGDPYGRQYYGASDSPFFYMWLFAVMDDDESNNPLPPESDEQVSTSILSYLQVVTAMQELSSDKKQ